MNKIIVSIGAAVSVVLVTSPAFASIVPDKIPEPGTLSIVGGVAVALLIANRFIRRK